MARTKHTQAFEARQRQIIDAAAACFQRDGLRGASMRDICAEARLSAGAVYRYFGRKEDLITAVAMRTRQGPTVSYTQEIDAETFWLTLHQFAQDSLSQIMERAALAAEVLAECMRSEALARDLHSRELWTTSVLATLIQHGQHCGEVDGALDPFETAGGLLAIIEGIVFRLKKTALDGHELGLRMFSELAARVLRGKAFTRQ